MLATLKWFFTPPVFPEDEDKTRTVRILFGLLGNMLAIMALGELGVIFVFKKKLIPGLAIGSMIVWILLSYVLAHRGRVKLANALFVGWFWLTISLAHVFLIGAVNTVFVAFHLAITVMAGILLGRRSAILMACLSAGLGLVLAILESAGYPLNHYFPGAPLADWFNFAFTLLLTLTPLNLTLQLSAQSLARAREENEQRRQAEEMQKQLIVELEQRNAELERLAYTLSHELKSPLITIRGFLGYMREDAVNGNVKRLEVDAQRITEGTEKMLRLINELIDLMSVGRIVHEFKEIPLRVLVDEAVELVREGIAHKETMVLIADDLSSIYGDHKLLVEVFQNLLENAVKFMGEQPEPKIEIGQRYEEGDIPTFYVRDNGIGIEPRFTDRIFGIFHKLDPLSEGTGVGLALVKRIIEYHGGKVWVESEGLGRGSTFCFTAPVKRP